MRVQDFPLAWRWTDPNHTFLPADKLAQIVPLSPTEAHVLHKEWMPVFDRYGNVVTTNFATIEKVSTEGEWQEDACSRTKHSTEPITNWLKEKEKTDKLDVFISWDERLAVRTNWELFVQQWSDFCYPSSDDAFVVPIQKQWLLAFHHEDEFSFCWSAKK